MPIYEFYCTDCNTVFNFFSSRVNTTKRPNCPKCANGPLDRMMSRFAVIRSGSSAEGKEMDNMPDIDESKLERAMAMLEREAESINEDDPRQAADLMRKLCDMTGMDMGSGMDEALRRMEAGEDPGAIEDEMGDALSEDNLFGPARKAVSRGPKKPPIHDATLYYL
ncbi:MAG: zinc ribbon domain-containing protein [Pseudomonadota bacterium]